MPSMTREDLLTKLAMDLADWPSISSVPGLTMGMTWTNHGAWLCWPQPKGSSPISRLSWHKERERLINKPSWANAPEDAKWLAQHANGAWDWFTPSDRNPTRGADGESWVLPWCKDHFRKSASKGAIPAGHDWRSTLERRPYSKKHALSPECMNSAIDNSHPQEYKTSWRIDAAWDGEYPEAIVTNQCVKTDKKSKYHQEIKPGVFVDVYDVLKAWGVNNPALQHLIKKALQPGQRGHKSTDQDMQDIIDSAFRAKELEE